MPVSPRSSLLLGLLRGFGSWLVVLLVTLVLGEVVCRFLFGIEPLTQESVLWRHHERWGWHHEPDSEDFFIKLGFEQHVRINSRGLREREIPYEKPAAVTRVLVLGDSSVVSFEVPPEAVFTRLAEDMLRKRGYDVQFVNAGVRGWGTDQALLFLREEGLEYQPDLVLYRWSGNDREDNATIHRPFRKYGKPWFHLDQTDSLVLRGVPVPPYPHASNLRVGENGEPVEKPVAPRTALTLWLRDLVICRSSFATGLLRLAVALPNAARNLRPIGSYDDSRDIAGFDAQTRLFRTTVAMVDEMRRASEEAGADFRVIFAGGPASTALLRALELPDLGDWRAFKESIPDGAEIRVPLDPHWNELGQRLYAEALSEALIHSGLLESARRDGGASETVSGGAGSPGT